MLRMRADLQFAAGRHSAALSFYLKSVAGVSKSRYISISILMKYSNFSRFYKKKLGPFYKKTQM